MIIELIIGLITLLFGILVLVHPKFLRIIVGLYFILMGLGIIATQVFGLF